MSAYQTTSAPKGSIGHRMYTYRKARRLTQMDLADRFSVSGPAIFKFERGLVTPSLKLWLLIAADLGVPEREAVLMWVRERLPKRQQEHVPEPAPFDPKALVDAYRAALKESDGPRKAQQLIATCPDIAPSIRRFAASDDLWGTLKPTPDELAYLIELDHLYPLLRVPQLRDAIVLARTIARRGQD